MSGIFETISVMPAITVFCLLAAQLVKVFTALDKRHLPVLCGIAGMVLGIVCFVFFPDFMPSQNIMAAAAKGVVSGWAATGANQIAKQYS